MCGVVGVLHSYLSNDVLVDAAYDVYRSLLTLQHRGQDAAGIVGYDFTTRKFHSHKDLGLVGQVFNEKVLSKLSGDMAIGHTRYATTGSDSKLDLQPLVTGFPVGLGIAHNGNILNYHEVSRFFSQDRGNQLLTNNDIELFQNFWCQSFSQYKDNFLGALIHGATEIVDKLRGAYALVGMVSDEGLFALRDPNGIRPLVLGQKREGNRLSWMVASETVSMNFLGFEYVRDVLPGELIFIDKKGELFSKILTKGHVAKPCMFEWVYFSGAESSIENQSVYGVRLNLGIGLAKQVKPFIESGEISPDIVCPVPDTSRTSAISLAEELGLPYREGLIKNRYTQRSFILKDQEARERAIELKLSPVVSEIQGKNILLVDDSIVRGSTSIKIIKLLKKYGAKEITLAISCPPLKHACFYGVDFPDPNQLVARNKTNDELAEYIGAKRVIYLTEENLKKGIGLEDVCMGCLDGEYPTPTDGSEEFKRRREEHKKSLALECL
ncbi:amidophosphoribosyltransferase [Halobacteriovorax marinus]|uniref:Amidophosphoribosyltransferase n=1 Tax=Halobacteriovorax marinus TaxID=97084 RepID=A0A1Y5FD09_9BACT|nr:amidophosphoribosyltransferase [Halobacteriovorax marinus]